MNLVYRVIPPPSEEQLLRMVRAAMEEARRFGVTSIHDISSTEDVRAYQTLADRGELTLRIYSLTPPFRIGKLRPRLGSAQALAMIGFISARSRDLPMARSAQPPRFLKSRTTTRQKRLACPTR